MMLSYDHARQKVIEVARARRRAPATELAELGQAFDRVLAHRVIADRDYPPFDRSPRDGFAVRAQDVGARSGTLAIIGEIKAADTFTGVIRPGQCVQIITGAAVPPGADPVLIRGVPKPPKTIRLNDGR